MGSMDDLDLAIITNEQAIASTPDDHPDHGAILNNLGRALLRRFESAGSIDDLARAITTNEQIVASTPDDHPNRAMYLNNLGGSLLRRFERTTSTDDLDRAITTNEQAVASDPDDHPNRAMCLNNLGNALQRRFEMTGSIDDLDRAFTTKQWAVLADTAPLSIRLQAASSYSDLLINQRCYKHAKPILEAAVRLLPIISSRTLKRSDQQYNISRFSNITSRAVSISLADADYPYNSLQLLELGRGILANLQLEVHSDISVLAISHPDLTEQFQEFRDRIDSPVIMNYPDSFTSSVTLDSSVFITERHTLVKKFDDLLRSIRSLDGFENFLRGPAESELHCLADRGPIVVFNVSEIRSDAFLITTDAIRSLHLPLLTSDSLENSAKRFFDVINNQDINRYRHAKLELNAVLEWLRDAAVKPVLKELGFTQMPSHGETWPKVWWVASGLLSILPIHAAGYHDSTPSETALDRVISSYASTVKSLSYARERLARANQVKQKEKAILVAMSTTPEQKNLPSVETEIEDLRKLFFNASIDTTVMQSPTRSQVLSKLSKHAIVHFACHGDPADDPSQSNLLLEDWKTASLAVSDLMSLNIKDYARRGGDFTRHLHSYLVAKSWTIFRVC